MSIVKTDKLFVVSPFFCEGNAYDTVTWVRRDAVIKNRDDEIVFSLKDAEFPEAWSQTAVNVVTEKYFNKHLGEKSLKQLLDRVANTIGLWGKEQNYFDDASAATFINELKYLIIHQYFAWNSPVWFNLGTCDNPMVSACFIQSLDDSMASIMQLVTNEANIFKNGGGTGTNFSTLRGSHESLSHGGKASGPVSFMKGFDSFAGIVKSGGKCLHPDQHVYTENGPVKVKDLADKDFICVSFDPPSKRYKLKKAHAWKSGIKPVVKVTTDKGEFLVSEDHPFRLSEGTAVLASALKAGQSLFACSVDQNRAYLRLHLRDGKKGKELIHRLVGHDILGWETTENTVHHIDKNTLNNHVDNLQLLTQAQHAGLHSDERVKNGTHIFQTNDFSHAGADNGMHSSSKFWQDTVKSQKLRDKQADILIKRNSAKEMQDAAAYIRMTNFAYSLINKGHTIDTFESYIQARKQEYSVDSKKKILNSITSRFGSYAAFIQEVHANNHKVVAVTPWGASEVYSVEVECPTADDKSSASGHNYVLWPNDSLTGSGVAVFNTRRSAKMVILNMDHPDIEEFIECKSLEEQRLKETIKHVKNKKIDFNYVYGTAAFQNANHSVRVTDDFMKKVVDGGEWSTKEVVTGKKYKTYKAADLLMSVSQAAHECGDPGIQYDTTINNWNTNPVSGRINAANPCAEFMSQNDSACNLASINLMKFVDLNAKTKEPFFNVDAFRRIVRLVFMSQEIIIDKASYPTPQIHDNTLRFRQIGLGHANLGGVLMVLGYPYDSAMATSIAAAITSLMTATAYVQSTELSEMRGAIDEWSKNKEAFVKVLTRHAKAHKKIPFSDEIENIMEAGAEAWRVAVKRAAEFGVRNSQVSVMAPCGTIGFMMDVQTTGIEPEISLVKYKALVGGGTIKMVNDLVPGVLKRLGYVEDKITAITQHITREGTIEGSELNAEHLAIFDCALVGSSRFIAPMGHVKMMAAVQPFLSGAVSKTVNIPNNSTVEDIFNIYVDAWKLGVKAIAVYRDGSKVFQPVTTSKDAVEEVAAETQVTPVRRALSDNIETIRHKFSIAGHRGYMHVGKYKDGDPGELFIRMSKAGSTINGLMDNFGIAVSLGLQYGVPIDAYIAKFTGTKFDPQGWTGNQDIRFAGSILDYIFRWMEVYFKKEKEEVVEKLEDEGKELKDDLEAIVVNDGPPCPSCGYLTVRNGSCYKCTNCGNSLGCS
jgi:ribonucleoside-diphosphate reductase alpha chain